MSMHVYEVRPRKDGRGFDLMSDVLPFGRLWYHRPDHAIGYAQHSSRSHDAVIRVYDESGNVVETHEHKGDFKGAVGEITWPAPLDESGPQIPICERPQ